MNIGRSEYARLKKAAVDLEALKDAVRRGLASWRCGCVAEKSGMFRRLSGLVVEKVKEDSIMICGSNSLSGMVERRLSAMVEYWKPRLGLHSWEISVEAVQKHKQQRCAETFIKPQMERASITVWRDEDREGGDDPVELDILHELVHVRLWAIDPYDAKGVVDDCREVAIDWLARALFRERYKEQETDDDDVWTCGICGRKRKGVEPVQDFEVGDACPEHYEKVPTHE